MKRISNPSAPKDKINPDRFRGVWSATPTPFTDKMAVDTVAVKRLVEHHLRLGVNGLFLCGTCGEGPWMTDSQRSTLLQAVVASARGRLLIAVQVTDNSAARMLDNIQAVAEDGADVAVIAPPYFLLNATPANVATLYLEAVRRSSLPIGIYDRGSHAAVVVPNDVLETLYAEPNVILVKDSSADPARMEIALKAQKARPALRLLNGNEFNCAAYIKAGYDGLLLGGGIFVGKLANQIMEAAQNGRMSEAERLQKRMNRLMWDVYGGRQITCWLTGLKHLLVEMKVFRTTRSYLNYPLTTGCREAIAKALEREKEALLP